MTCSWCHKMTSQRLVCTAATRFVSPRGCKTWAAPTACLYVMTHYYPRLRGQRNVAGGWRDTRSMYGESSLLAQTRMEHISLLQVGKHLNNILKFGSNLRKWQRSRHSDWLRAGRPRTPSSSHSRGDIFSSPRRPDRFWVPPSLQSNGYRGAYSPVLKRPGREADHSPPPSVEVKNTWTYTTTSPYAFMG
jgi:hypothetical protein